MSEIPRVRYGIEAIPVQHQGQNLVAIRDALGFSEETVLVSRDVYFILSLLDGQHSPLDIQEAYMREFGTILFSEKLQEILKFLDSNYFLENEHFENLREEVTEAFIASRVRAPYHAGKSYPEEPDLLEQELNSFFLGFKESPGKPVLNSLNKDVIGIIAPHIDLRQGGVTYAHSYKVLAESRRSPDIFVILGIGHEAIENYFAVSEKDFATPFGIVKTDKETVRELIRCCPRDIKAGEFAHRKEHSIEFQALFLRFMFPDAEIVPILCSYGTDDWMHDKDFILEFTEALGNVLKDVQKSFALVTGVDLSHIGPRYGDNFRPHQGTIAEVARHDRAILDTLIAVRADEFMDMLVSEGNEKRVCGLPALFVMSKVLEMLQIRGLEGDLLHYNTAVVDDFNSFVSFASVAFTH